MLNFIANTLWNIFFGLIVLIMIGAMLGL